MRPPLPLQSNLSRRMGQMVHGQGAVLVGSDSDAVRCYVGGGRCGGEGYGRRLGVRIGGRWPDCIMLLWGRKSKVRVDPWVNPLSLGRWRLVFAEALYHSVVCVGHLGCCLFLCLVGCPGNYIYYFAFAVEGDNFYLIFFEAAVCIEGDAANVCHGFEVFESYYCAPGRV